MFLRAVTIPLTVIPGIGQSVEKKLARLGIYNILDLLCHYPRDWEDRGITIPISKFHNSHVCTEVAVVAHDRIGFGRKRTAKIYVEDESGRAALLCFNRPWLEKQLTLGKHFKLWGRFYYKYGEIQSSAFELEPVSEKYANDTKGGIIPGILPVYPLTAGLSQVTLRRFTGIAVKRYTTELENELPAEIIERYNLLSKADAVRAIHFPASAEELTLAKKTLIYEELFYLEVMVGKRALARKGPGAGDREPGESDSKAKGYFQQFSVLQQRLLERLPFQLTKGQQEAVNDINNDIANQNFSMARLLQGDVGSGKTLVSFMAALRTVDENGQAALMAPTELLARQHAENSARLLQPLGIRIAYLTGNIKTAGRKDLLKNLVSGEIDIVVGTHALFSKDVIYKNLRLVVVDEQHRFGVTQRSLIMAKAATPIY